MCHFKKHHSDLPDTYKDEAEELKKWLIDHAKLPASLTEEEARHVGLGSDAAHFRCLLCNDEGNEMLKTSAAQHFKKRHGILTKGWVVIQDAKTLRRSLKYTHLEEYFAQQEETNEEASAQAQDEYHEAAVDYEAVGGAWYEDQPYEEYQLGDGLAKDVWQDAEAEEDEDCGDEAQGGYQEAFFLVCFL